MAAITWTDVTDIAPEQSAVGASARTKILAWVNVALDVSLFGGESGTLLVLVRSNLAAHIGVGAMPANTGDTTGPVTSQSEGDVSVSYGVGWGSMQPLGSTRYGQTYIELLNMSPARAGLLL